MEDKALSVALKAMRKGQCIVILDSKCREIETNLFFLVASIFPLFLRSLRIVAWREMYISMAHDVAFTFGFPFIREVPITHP